MYYFLTYGSLRRGESNFNAYCSYYNLEYIKTIEILGYKLYSFGPYPGINYTGDEKDVLVCDLLGTNQKECSDSIDSMELGAGYHIEEKVIPYDEKEVTAKLYVYSNPLTDNLVPSGDWSKYLKEKYEKHKQVF